VIQRQLAESVEHPSTPGVVWKEIDVPVRAVALPNRGQPLDELPAKVGFLDVWDVERIRREWRIPSLEGTF
jgi:hypothetical protein